MRPARTVFRRVFPVRWGAFAQPTFIGSGTICLPCMCRRVWIDVM